MIPRAEEGKGGSQKSCYAVHVTFGSVLVKS